MWTETTRPKYDRKALRYYRNEPGSQRYPPLFRPFFSREGNFIGVVSNFRSHRAKRRLTKAFRRHSDFPIEHLTTFDFTYDLAAEREMTDVQLDSVLILRRV